MFDRSSAPTWLFSFVDLAFLLLIALTQIASSRDTPAPTFGELPVPRVITESAAVIEPTRTPRWQVRVHPPTRRGDPSPFVLVPGAPDAAAAAATAGQGDGERLALEGLAQRLAGLRSEDLAKPLLAPHQDARAADLLSAAGLLEDHWPSERRATIAPVSAGPPAR